MNRSIITQKNQTIFDIAAQHYGDVGKFDRVLQLNPHLVNDYTEAIREGIMVDINEFDMAWPLMPGQSVMIDRLAVNRAVVREFEKEVFVSFEKNDIL